MKTSLLILGINILFVFVFWSCQQNSLLVSNLNFSSSSGVDTIGPITNPPLTDSTPITTLIDSIYQDSLLKLARLKARYEETYAPNTPFSTKILVYEAHLDTLDLILVDSRYKSFNYLNNAFPNDYLMITNGGMFHSGGMPVGLFQQDSVQIQPLNIDSGDGNFFLKPNGVFFITEDNIASVLESKLFLDSIYNKETPLKIATQSGPMLIINGKHHPLFKQNSTSKHIRSGVGVTKDQKLIFIISEELVNFHTFASIFLEKGCTNALYLDGAISSMYIKEMGINIGNYRTRFGPVIGLYRKPNKEIIIQDSTKKSVPTQKL